MDTSRIKFDPAVVARYSNKVEVDTRYRSTTPTTTVRKKRPLMDDITSDTAVKQTKETKTKNTTKPTPTSTAKRNCNDLEPTTKVADAALFSLPSFKKQKTTHESDKPQSKATLNAKLPLKNGTQTATTSKIISKPTSITPSKSTIPPSSSITKGLNGTNNKPSYSSVVSKTPSSLSSSTIKPPTSTTTKPLPSKPLSTAPKLTTNKPLTTTAKSSPTLTSKSPLLSSSSSRPLPPTSKLVGSAAKPLNNKPPINKSGPSSSSSSSSSTSLPKGKVPAKPATPALKKPAPNKGGVTARPSLSSSSSSSSSVRSTPLSSMSKSAPSSMSRPNPNQARPNPSQARLPNKPGLQGRPLQNGMPQKRGTDNEYELDPVADNEELGEEERFWNNNYSSAIQNLFKRKHNYPPMQYSDEEDVKETGFLDWEEEENISEAVARREDREEFLSEKKRKLLKQKAKLKS